MRISDWSSDVCSSDLGSVSCGPFTSTPVGLDEPGICSAQMWRMTTPAITNGSRKCREKKRVSAALSTAKTPSSQLTIASPTTGKAEHRLVLTVAPPKLIRPPGRHKPARKIVEWGRRVCEREELGRERN